MSGCVRGDEAARRPDGRRVREGKPGDGVGMQMGWEGEGREAGGKTEGVGVRGGDGCKGGEGRSRERRTTKEERGEGGAGEAAQTQVSNSNENRSNAESLFTASRRRDICL